MDKTFISRIRASDPLYQQVWEIREIVLRQPLGLSLSNEDLSQDQHDTIFVALHNGKAIGCLMAMHLDAGTLKLRQMAVYPDWQGKSIGRMLMNDAEAFAKEHSYSRISLHARKYAMDFYSKLGYDTIGDEFTEVNIPHYKMTKSLQ
jgi:predicted GNAT family N-acyltransferase